MVLVHNKLVIYGGGDLTYTYGMEQWHERDVGTVHWLDTTTWTYGAPSIPYAAIGIPVLNQSFRNEKLFLTTVLGTSLQG